MALIHIPLEQIDQNALERLIQGAAPETRVIDYKAETYGKADADHAEFLADVSSFANTAGGDVVIGMKATSGVPVEFAPLKDDIDGEILRLDNIARTGLQPRVLNFRVWPVPLKQGGHVVIIRVPRSYNPPHRVIRQGKGQNRFWARSSAGKYEPNVDELRSLFLLAPQLADRIRAFRAERLDKIVAGRTPVRLQEHRCLVLHVVLFSGFDIGMALSMPRLAREDWVRFPAMGSSQPTTRRINFDGVLAIPNPNPPVRAYTQIFRSGIIEAVESSFVIPADPQRGRVEAIPAALLEEYLIQSSTVYLKGLHAVGVEPPYAVLASLVGVRDLQISIARRFYDAFEEWPQLDSERYEFHEVIFEDVPEDRERCARAIRPMLDQLANAAGAPASPNFDDQGNYRPPS